MLAIRKTLEDVHEGMTEIQAEGERPAELSDSVKHIAKNYSRGAACLHWRREQRQFKSHAVPAVDCIEEAVAASKKDRKRPREMAAAAMDMDGDEVAMGINLLGNSLGNRLCSSLIFLLKTVMYKGSKANSMSFLNQELQRWQRISKSPQHFGRFTWDLLDYDGPRKYPKGKWSKGMDTGKVTKFIEFLLSEILAENEHSEHGPMLTLIQDGCKSIGVFLRTLFKAGFFLTEQEAHQAISAGYTFLQTYQKLAKTAFSLNKALYKLKPKAHAFAHLVLEMLVQFKQDRSCVCNCVAFSTFMCEDFVGHIARLSRRVSAKVQGKKVIFRYLVALRRALLQET
eukprot:s3258_g3.t1